jgi:hypothetical protein
MKRIRRFLALAPFTVADAGYTNAVINDSERVTDKDSLLAFTRSSGFIKFLFEFLVPFRL